MKFHGRLKMKMECELGRTKLFNTKLCKQSREGFTALISACVSYAIHAICYALSCKFTLGHNGVSEDLMSF